MGRQHSSKSVPLGRAVVVRIEQFADVKEHAVGEGRNDCHLSWVVTFDRRYYICA